MSVKTMSYNIEGLFFLRHWIIIIAVFISLYAFALFAMVLAKLCNFFVTTCNDFCLQILRSSCHQRFINLENFLIFAFSKQTYWIFFLATSDFFNCNNSTGEMNENLNYSHP